jgi:transposase
MPGTIHNLEATVRGLHYELHMRELRIKEQEKIIARLEQQVEELKQQALAAVPDSEQSPPTLPSFVKANVPRRRRKKPGRKQGHAPALRPLPEQIDVHQDTPLPIDEQGRASCPHCRSILSELKDHERLVEDIIPAKVQVTCYHTTSGFCPCCRRRVESRAAEQPPDFGELSRAAADVPHAQLGINAIATGVLLRVKHRLPFRSVAEVFADLPGLSVSPGTIARQVQRVAGLLEKDYQGLLLELRAAEVNYADETGWKTDGQNGQLWAVTNPTTTAYHVDKSRGSKVIQKLLGKAYSGTLVSDFCSAYSPMDCKKQKCNTHLLRELVTCAKESPEFAAGKFFIKSKRLIKEMLLLKGRWDKLGDRRYFARVKRLEKRLESLANGSYELADEKRIAARMRRHRTELTAFLHQKNLDGTNNAAERAIRPAVVARKISGGSRSKAGADAWAKLASLVRTAGQRGLDVLGTIKSKLQAAWAGDTPAAMPVQQ